jgi:hypothetical protein
VSKDGGALRMDSLTSAELSVAFGGEWGHSVVSVARLMRIFTGETLVALLARRL